MILKTKSLFKILFIIIIIFLVRVITFTNKTSLTTLESFTGVITDISLTNNQNYKVIINNQESIIIYLEKDIYSVGDIVEATGKFNQIQAPTTPYLFNYQLFYQSKKIFWQVENPQVRYLSRTGNIFLITKGYIQKLLKHHPHHAYLKLLLFGDSSEIENEVYESYKINNLLHLFALGSLQVMFLLKIFNQLKIKYFGVFIITIYIIITNYPYVLIKALLSNLLIKNQNLIIKEIILIISLLIVWPLYIYQPGFWFVSLIGVFVKLTKNKTEKLTIIMIVVMPLILYYNHQINIMFLVNIIISFIYNSLLLPILLFSIIFPIIIPLVGVFIKVFEEMSLFCANNFSLIIPIFKPNIIELTGFYISLFLILKCPKKSFSLVYRTTILIIIYVIVRKNLIQNHFIFFDVGNGDSSLLYYNHKSFLIDTGGLYNNPDYYVKNTIIPYFTALGISKLDYLFISHGDLDHIGGAKYLLEKNYVKEVIINGNQTTQVEEELLKDQRVSKNQSFKLNQSNLVIEAINNTKIKKENNSSLVLKITTKEKSFLLTGDITKEEENILPKDNIKDTNYLKVAHHGSKTSTSEGFISIVNPKYAIISAGCNNRYKHPHQETLEILNRFTNVINTCQSGSIIVILNKN